ncbi:unnamed protein product, partial [Didymodactylos carnosus]
MQLAESRSIEPSTIPDINDLLTKFLQQFPLLYTKRHNVQSVHSIAHIGATVQDFEFLTASSLFLFLISGLITSTIHATRRHAIEIRNNLRFLRLACIEIDKP